MIKAQITIEANDASELLHALDVISVDIDDTDLAEQGYKSEFEDAGVKVKAVVTVE